jgi:hypothetical protein
MTGYDPESIGRSIRRYMAGLLTQPWSVALEAREVRDDQRPAGVIELGEVRTRRARISIPQGEVEEFAPVTVTLYPRILDVDGTTYLDARVTAREARLLSDSIRQLIVSGAEGVAMSGPERFPLWDYSAVAPGTPGPADPIDVLWVEDYSVRTLQDTDDLRRWSVAVDARLSWERAGRVPPAGVPLTDITGTFKPVGSGGVPLP